MEKKLYFYYLKVAIAIKLVVIGGSSLHHVQCKNPHGLLSKLVESNGVFNIGDSVSLAF